MAAAGNIANLPPQALRKAKQLIRKSETLPLAESLDMAATMQAQLQQLNDHHEAIDSIREKRKPVFTGS